MEQAQKDIEKLLPAIQRQEIQAMSREGIRGEKQFLIETHAERVNAIVRPATSFFHSRTQLIYSPR